MEITLGFAIKRKTECYEHLEEVKDRPVPRQELIDSAKAMYDYWTERCWELRKEREDAVEEQERRV